MANVTKPILLDETGRDIAMAINGVERRLAGNTVTNSETQCFNSSDIFATNQSNAITCTSVSRYLLSETSNVMMFGHNLTNGNPYNSSAIWLEIYADANNTIGMYIEAYTLYFRAKVNGSYVVNVAHANTEGTFWNDLGYSLSNWVIIDLQNKQIRLEAKKNNGTFATLLTQDISSVSLLNFKEFNIRTAVNEQFSCQRASKNIRINNVVCPYMLANYALKYGEYLGLDARTPQSSGGSNDGDDIFLRLGGTITETISTKHKKAHANNTSYTYFACGADSTIYSTKQGMWSCVKVKFTNMSANFKIGASSPLHLFYVTDTNGTPVLYVDKQKYEYYPTANVDYFTPTADTWYYIYGAMFGSQNLQYIASYLLYLLGEADIEAIAIGCGYMAAQNMCTANFNGVYFTGTIPMLPATTPTFVTPKWESMARPVLYAKYCDTNGKIFMRGNISWTQISNA